MEIKSLKKYDEYVITSSKVQSILIFPLTPSRFSYKWVADCLITVVFCGSLSGIYEATPQTLLLSFYTSSASLSKSGSGGNPQGLCRYVSISVCSVWVSWEIIDCCYPTSVNRWWQHCAQRWTWRVKYCSKMNLVSFGHFKTLYAHSQCENCF